MSTGSREEPTSKQTSDAHPETPIFFALGASFSEPTISSSPSVYREAFRSVAPSVYIRDPDFHFLGVVAGRVYYVRVGGLRLTVKC